MIRTGKKAQEFALGRVGGHMPQAGLCLQFTRTVFGVGPKFGSAIAAWNHAAHRHTGRPPAGAVVPVFFRTPSRFRHVAVVLGNGKVVSTNGAKISLWSSIDQVATLFRGPYLGWSEDLNGVRVYTLGGPRTLPVTGVWGSMTTKALQRRFGTRVDGVISGQVRTDANKHVGALKVGSEGSLLVVAMQRWLGIAPDGQLDGATVRALQKRFGTHVDGVVSRPSSLVTAMQRALNKKASIFPAEETIGAPAPVDENLLPDGSTLPLDPDDLEIVLADIGIEPVEAPAEAEEVDDDTDDVVDDPAADAAAADTDGVDEADPDLDEAHELGGAPQDEEAVLEAESVDAAGAGS
ncbi:MAG TPA: peptidoglycan-binding domain-containing protein [Luteimicrobium sp.]|nr:peptidoglycan-binding domain-containing protein [Luteimicrobium sp.]